MTALQQIIFIILFHFHIKRAIVRKLCVSKDQFCE